MRAFRPVALVALATLAVLALPASAQQNTETKHYTVTQSVKRLVVDSERGAVSVTAGARTRITAVLHWDVTKPTVSYRVEGGVLRIVTSCPRLPTDQVVVRVDECSVDLAITVPAKAATAVDTAYGDVVVRNMRADQRLDTAYGDVVLERVTANSIVADTAYGRIIADVSARTLDLDTSYGGIRVSVPRGLWAIDADTSYGKVDINNITVYSRAPRKIKADTSYGNIVINGR